MGIQRRVQGQRESMARPGTVRSLECCSSAVTFLLFFKQLREEKLPVIAGEVVPLLIY